jgi:cytochrome P450
LIRLAGRDTTAALLTLKFYMLAINPRVLEKVRYYEILLHDEDSLEIKDAL